jgi:hypothetical protein
MTANRDDRKEAKVLPDHWQKHERREARGERLKVMYLLRIFGVYSASDTGVVTGKTGKQSMLPCVLFGEGLTGTLLCFSRRFVSLWTALNHSFAILHTSVILFA